MSNRRKKAVRVLCYVLGGLCILLLVLHLCLGVIITKTVNAVGPSILGVPVSLESASVNLFSGKASLKGLEIGNPEGFDTPYLFHLDSIAIDICLSDCLHGTTHIQDIVVSGPRVWYHQKLTKSNLSSFLAILEEKHPSADEEEPEEKTEGEAGNPVVIDHLLVENGTIGLKVGAQMEMPLLEIELKDIGRDGAMMPAQIVVLLAKSIGGSVLTAISNAGGWVTEGVTETGKDALEGVKKAGEGIRSLFTDDDDEPEASGKTAVTPEPEKK